MDRLINVRLFSVELKDGAGLSFSSALQRAITRTIQEREEELEPDVVIRLERLTSQHGLFCGEFVRLQANNLPPKALRGKPIESLGVASIGHTTAFAFDPKLSVLALQLARNGITATRIALYAEALAIGTSYDILPVPNEEIWEKLKKGGVRGVEFRVSSPNELRSIDTQTQSVKRGIAAMKESLQATQIEVTMTMARGEANMNRKKAVALFGWLQRERQEERGGVSKLKARINSEDSEATETLNLIGGHMGDKELLELPNDDPNASYRLRRDYINLVLEKNRKVLEAMYG
jgi:hypothetical protein